MMPYLTTDMSKQEILSAGLTILQDGVGQIEKYRIPADGTFTSSYIRGMAVLVPNLDKNQALMESYILGE
jgi:hypothetical protein